jgi:hypothetical protein
MIAKKGLGSANLSVGTHDLDKFGDEYIISHSFLRLYEDLTIYINDS